MAAPNSPLPQHVFDVVDSMDLDKLASLFTDDARLRFGNQPPFEGLGAIRDGVKGFFDTIAGIRHTLVRVWQIGDDTVAHADATYQRKDGTDVTLPAATIYHSDRDGKIDDYRVFVDVTPIYL
ncbi:nuclear transport factor 2 family protein [Mycobacterium sp. pR1184]|uniref:nuclear transport factor 2 family protein n=1 Tax=Mycobacterium sp. pR1184 TaxID=3238981 RepID=UPI00351AB59E